MEQADTPQAKIGKSREKVLEEEIERPQKALKNSKENEAKEKRKVDQLKRKLEQNRQDDKGKEENALFAAGPTSSYHVNRAARDVLGPAWEMLRAVGFGKEINPGERVVCNACTRCERYEPSGNLAEDCCFSCGCLVQEHALGLEVEHRAYEMLLETKAAQAFNCTAGRAVHSSIVLGARVEIEYKDFGVRVWVPPRPPGKAEQTFLGVTTLPLDEIYLSIETLKNGAFQKEKYHILYSNCNTFADYVSRKLVGRGLDAKFMALQFQLAKNLVTRKAVEYSYSSFSRMQQWKER